MERLREAHAPDVALPHAAVKLSVSKLLEKLPRDSWWVLHDVPFGARARTIDHLVVGRSGVFVLRTRNHPGATITVSGKGLWVDGRRTDYHPVASSEALEVRTRLSEALASRIPVKPVIVVVCHHLKVESPSGEVAIVRRRDLVKWLRSFPPILPLSAASTIARTAGRSSTWTVPPAPGGPPG